MVDEFLHPLQLLTELIIDDRGLLGFEVYFVGELRNLVFDLNKLLRMLVLELGSGL